MPQPSPNPPHPADDREKLIAARAARLRQARIAAGFKTLRAAAKKSGIIEDTYRAHEIGKNTFDADVALKYSKAFGVDLVWLMLPGLTDETGIEGADTVRATRLLEQLVVALRSGDIRALANATEEAEQFLSKRR
ncbi:helix-turn-helix domain-containing protein [Phyllobacterium leguminum]|uniref:HTH cro/C1-type domain-containing protein n=1 Tax=Phyllobacterium leguminum TaxID=314237 RepID=A0A318T3W6_9HYPH|nr:helix-turn-helix domain-containing protein [Phyllobacterium leguminum]PYE87413.1 hypothetical protein C7477_11334 [Phyllobacterium leguminum]